MVTTPTILSLSPQCLSINFILHHLQLSIPSIPRNDSCSSFLVFYSILLLSLPCGPPMLSPAVTLLVWSAQTIGRLVGSDLLHPWIVWLINFSLAPGPFYSCFTLVLLLFYSCFTFVLFVHIVSVVFPFLPCFHLAQIYPEPCCSLIECPCVLFPDAFSSYISLLAFGLLALWHLGSRPLALSLWLSASVFFPDWLLCISLSLGLLIQESIITLALGLFLS